MGAAALKRKRRRRYFRRKKTSSSWTLPARNDSSAHRRFRRRLHIAVHQCESTIVDGCIVNLLYPRRQWQRKTFRLIAAPNRKIKSPDRNQQGFPCCFELY